MSAAPTTTAVTKSKPASSEQDAGEQAAPPAIATGKIRGFNGAAGSGPGNGASKGAPIALNVDNLEFVEELYAAYTANPQGVPNDWRQYFDSLAGGNGTAGTVYRSGPTFKSRSIFNPPAAKGAPGSAAAAAAHDEASALQERVDMLIRNFRVRGHMLAKVDPLGQPRHEPAELTPEFYGFTEADFILSFSTHASGGPDTRTLREIWQWLRNTYCRSIGVQFTHIDSHTVREWLQNQMESTENRLALTRAEQLRILQRLTDAWAFEKFVAKKHVGKKAFSLEGAESLMPLLDLAIEKAGADGVKEIVIGMAHRGRLNVLANIAGKSPRDIFREFMDIDHELHVGRGDVKYHLGHSTERATQSGNRVHISLCFNPSHLEYVNPVALGRLRAKMDRYHDMERTQGLAILIHGDAAFAGEGITQETLNLSELKGYHTGGALHVIVNNQIGFTTDPREARSSVYATDVAKMLQVPIFHVNGEDPEAVAQVVGLALDFRRKFHRDVVIDMYCYRLRGHNEGDEPEFTQPMMYRAIKQRKSVRDSYVDMLLQMGGITRAEADAMVEAKNRELEAEYEAASREDYVLRAEMLQGIWKGYKGGYEKDTPDVPTGVPVPRLKDLLTRQTMLPEKFHPHPTLQKFALKARQEMARGDKLLDWANAEALAFASLLTEGHPVRLSGQDAGRGTFSHRHAILHDYEDGGRYIPLEHLADDQAQFEVINSPLSESGVLGFDYGFSLDCPNGLVLWEAQFGDFINVAQVIIDQFLVSAEDKWKRLSGLVMLLPHGFEGAGPEHSSARFERFLELCAHDNIQVVYPTTPAQYFHLLRRQVKRVLRKPLIIMTPKSLLRPQISSLEELAEGTFQRVIPDNHPTPAKKIDRILLCTGKVFYEIEKRRSELKRDDVAVVRVEQLYPLPTEALKLALARYPEGTPALWVQEEPENMGAWRFMRVHYGEKLLGKYPLQCIARPASGTPATGSTKSHEHEQDELLTRAFAKK